MKISLLGNCQTKALTWYIQQLNLDFDVKWISPDFHNIQKWQLQNPFYGKNIQIISNVNESKQTLQNSEYIIYQHIKQKRTKHFNSEEIKKYQSHAQLISVSSFCYEPEDPQEEALKGMIDRANKHNIDIPAHKIIEKHGAKINIQGFNMHPNVFYFLELVREICKKTDWDYYSDEQYNQYLKEGYPFG
jgi:hypothetical protein